MLAALVVAAACTQSDSAGGSGSIGSSASPSSVRNVAGVAVDVIDSAIDPQTHWNPQQEPAGTH